MPTAMDRSWFPTPLTDTSDCGSGMRTEFMSFLKGIPEWSRAIAAFDSRLVWIARRRLDGAYRGMFGDVLWPILGFHLPRRFVVQSANNGIQRERLIFGVKLFLEPGIGQDHRLRQAEKVGHDGVE